MRTFVAAVLLLAALSPIVSAQECALPPIAMRGVNIFTEEQENYLGDAVAEQFEREYRVVPGALNDELQAVGKRLLAAAPPTKIDIRFLLIDVPEINAYTFPGGRVYVTRKLVAAVRNEDELAGVLAHELGHVYFRHSAVDFSELFRSVLGVTTLGDRADVHARYHQLLENVARKGGKLGHKIDREQGQADQFGIVLAGRAGYRAEAHGQLWDRVLEMKGGTGNWFSDLFGTTKPEGKRLREMLHTSHTMLAGCKPGKPAIAEFAKWQSAVVAYSPESRKAELPGLVWRREVKPPLRTVISYLHYSADGRYILAQDDFSIFVLQREPFSFLFRIDAREAFRPHFTPDQKGIVFHTAGLRVERWDIPSKSRVDVHEIFTADTCSESEVSPTGELLACFGLPNLRLLNVKDSQTVFEQENFHQLSYAEYFNIVLGRILDLEARYRLMNLGFSPDGRYLVAGRANDALAYDTVEHKKISLPGSIRDLVGRSFDFQSRDRLVGVNDNNPAKSGIVRFPDGQKVSQLSLARQDVIASSQSDVIFLSPIKDWALGVFDVPSNRIVMGNKTGALDVFQNIYVTERLSGELVLFDRTKGEEASLGQLELPLGPLGTLRSFAVSEDFRYLAISGRTRGAIFDLESGGRVAYVRGFRAAHFSDDSAYLDFPELDEQKRQIARFSLERSEFTGSVPVGDGRVYKVGRYILDYKPKKKDADTERDTTLVVSDADRMKVLWQKVFPKETPTHYINAGEDIIVFAWRLNSGAAKAELSSDPEVAQRAELAGRKENNYLLEVVDLTNGRVLGKVVIDTGKGSFRIGDVDANDDYLLLSDWANRVLVYSLKTGDVVERYFGNRVNVSRAAGVFSIQTAEGKLSLYDLVTRKRLQDYTFPSPVRSTFSKDGKQLFALTEDQQAYLLELPARTAAAK